MLPHPLLRCALLMAALGCSKPAEAPRRVTLNRTGGSTFELVTGVGQLPHCLAFTVAKTSGVMRQLTMSKGNQAFDCPEGVAIGRHGYRVPLADGPVRVYVLFTSQAVNAGSVVQQLLEAPDRQHLSVMNMRLPGTAQLETLDFTPEEDVAPEVGLVVSDAGP